jgi:hypothetical protein
MRDFFVLHPVTEKNLSHFLKIRFHFPKISSGKRCAEQAKNGENEKKWFFFGKWYSGPPPEVVRGFFGGGGGVRWNRVLTPVRGWYWKQPFQTPPLVKLRIVRGGSGIFNYVDLFCFMISRGL